MPFTHFKNSENSAFLTSEQMKVVQKFAEASVTSLFEPPAVMRQRAKLPPKMNSMNRSELLEKGFIAHSPASVLGEAHDEFGEPQDLALRAAHQTQMRRDGADNAQRSPRDLFGEEVGEW